MGAWSRSKVSKGTDVAGRETLVLEGNAWCDLKEHMS